MRRLLVKVSWPLADTLGPKAIQALKLVFLTRLLGPSEFGDFTLALIFLAISESVSDFGFRQAIVQQRHEPTESEQSALNTVLLLRGVCVLPLMVAVASILEWFSTKVDTLSVLFVSVLPLARGLYTVSTALALRRLDFRRLFFVDVSWRVLDLLLTFAAVLLVARTSRVAVATAAMAEAFAPLFAGLILNQKLSFSFDFASVKGISSYGRWIWGQSMLTGIANQFDKVYVAGKFGTQAMGGYQGVHRLMQMVIADPVVMVVGVWFPRLAQDLREAPDRTRVLFAKQVQLFALGLTVLVALLNWGKEYLVVFALGSRWASYASYVPIFGSSMALGAFISILVTWHRADGTPHAVTFGTLCQVVVYVGGVLFLGEYWGGLGVARAANMSLLVVWAVLFVALGKDLVRTLVLTMGCPLLVASALVSTLPGAFTQWSVAALGILASMMLLREALGFRKNFVCKPAPKISS